MSVYLSSSDILSILESFHVIDNFITVKSRVNVLNHHILLSSCWSGGAIFSRKMWCKLFGDLNTICYTDSVVYTIAAFVLIELDVNETHDKLSFNTLHVLVFVLNKTSSWWICCARIIQRSRVKLKVVLITLLFDSESCPNYSFFNWFKLPAVTNYILNDCIVWSTRIFLHQNAPSWVDIIIAEWRLAHSLENSVGVAPNTGTTVLLISWRIGHTKKTKLHSDKFLCEVWIFYPSWSHIVCLLIHNFRVFHIDLHVGRIRVRVEFDISWERFRSSWNVVWITNLSAARNENVDLLWDKWVIFLLLTHHIDRVIDNQIDCI